MKFSIPFTNYALNIQVGSPNSLGLRATAIFLMGAATVVKTAADFSVKLVKTVGEGFESITVFKPERPIRDVACDGHEARMANEDVEYYTKILKGEYGLASEISDNPQHIPSINGTFCNYLEVYNSSLKACFENQTFKQLYEYQTKLFKGAAQDIKNQLEKSESDCSPLSTKAIVAIASIVATGGVIAGWCTFCRSRQSPQNAVVQTEGSEPLSKTGSPSRLFNSSGSRRNPKETF
ncbi:MAG: hypothetical protein K0U12_02265 [Gammaproteobacteria bacterium]|nr:hypothetical protein [Gammaproteobacteria bacterium]